MRLSIVDVEEMLEPIPEVFLKIQVAPAQRPPSADGPAPHHVSKRLHALRNLHEQLTSSVDVNYPASVVPDFPTGVQNEHLMQDRVIYTDLLNNWLQKLAATTVCHSHKAFQEFFQLTDNYVNTFATSSACSSSANFGRQEVLPARAGSDTVIGYGYGGPVGGAAHTTAATAGTTSGEISFGAGGRGASDGQLRGSGGGGYGAPYGHDNFYVGGSYGYGGSSSSSSWWRPPPTSYAAPLNYITPPSTQGARYPVSMPQLPLGSSSHGATMMPGSEVTVFDNPSSQKYLSSMLFHQDMPIPDRYAPPILGPAVEEREDPYAATDVFALQGGDGGVVTSSNGILTLTPAYGAGMSQGELEAAVLPGSGGGGGIRVQSSGSTTMRIATTTSSAAVHHASSPSSLLAASTGPHQSQPQLVPQNDPFPHDGHAFHDEFVLRYRPPPALSIDEDDDVQIYNGRRDDDLLYQLGAQAQTSANMTSAYATHLHHGHGATATGSGSLFGGGAGGYISAAEPRPFPLLSGGGAHDQQMMSGATSSTAAAAAKHENSFLVIPEPQEHRVPGTQPPTPAAADGPPPDALMGSFAILTPVDDPTRSARTAAAATTNRNQQPFGALLGSSQLPDHGGARPAGARAAAPPAAQRQSDRNDINSPATSNGREARSTSTRSPTATGNSRYLLRPSPSKDQNQNGAGLGQQPPTPTTLDALHQQPDSPPSVSVDVGDRRCVVCLSRETTHAPMPCGHLCLCDKCHLAPNMQRTCPICRTPIERFVRIFKVT